jgi:hypothetical protein
MENHGYTNRYVDVHNKIKSFKDRLRETNKSHASRREDTLARESKEMGITDKESSGANSLTLPPSDPA